MSNITWAVAGQHGRIVESDNLQHLSNMTWAFEVLDMDMDMEMALRLHFGLSRLQDTRTRGEEAR